MITGMGKTERPKSKIRGGIGNGSQYKFNGVDDLFDHNLTEIKSLREREKKRTNITNKERKRRNWILI